MQHNPVMSEKRARKLDAIMSRDGCSCVWCGRNLMEHMIEATVEHVIPQLKGGPCWLENEVLACAGCNHARQHMAAEIWLEQCRRRGYRPRDDLIVASLMRLDTAIGRRGGCRKARPHLARQLRIVAKIASKR